MPQEVTNPIWIAWWNTGLCPGHGTVDARTELLPGASEIVRQLIENDSVDLLALGEITPDLAEQLYPLNNSAKPFRAIRTDSLNNVDIGILYNTDRIQIVEHEFRRVSVLGKNKDAGLYAKIRIVGNPSLLHVFAVHWPSRLHDQDGTWRGFCATDLRSSVNRLTEGEPVIILGDFNDEPQDISVCKNLQSSRERALVRKRARLLYNPFWRLLGERQLLNTDEDLRLGAGTHFFGSGSLTRWLTIDQILVSAELLGSSDWVLLEEEVGIWQAPPLLTKKGRIATGFGHFPVIAAIAQAVETSEGENDDG